LGFKYEFVIPRFEFGQKPEKLKKYLGHPVLLFDLQLPKKTLHNTPSWSRLPFMESVNKQAKDGVILP
jgi:uncharacterized protein YcgL (UPF0745 family)